VSDFAATPLYGGRHTYIYSAALCAPDSDAVVGGIGIVFDSAPQFAAMLQDALPRDADGGPMQGAFAVFLDRAGYVISCSDEHYRAGDRISLDGEFLQLQASASHSGIVRYGTHYYALGACMSSGYREYKSRQDAYSNDVLALIFQPLCEAGVAATAQTPPAPLQLRSNRGAEGGTTEIATFNIGRQWFGLAAERIVEAVDPVGIADVPGAGSNFCGYLMYRSEPIPVYDIVDMVNAGAHQTDVKKQVIVLRKADGACFGIVADGLGEIPEIALSRLQALPPMLAGGNVLGEMLVRPEEGTERKDDILMVLGVDRIAARLGVIPLNPSEDSVIAIDASRQMLSSSSA
jgi:chemotaxis signal transduction protein